MSQTLGDRIRDRRTQIGLTQQETASRADISSGALSRLENDHVANPGLGTMKKIAHVLGVSVDWLICGKLCRPAAEKQREIYTRR